MLAPFACLCAIIMWEPLFAVFVLVLPTLILACMRRDPVTVLTLYIVLLFGVPSSLIFAPLGAAGTPANLVGIIGLWWWASAKIVPELGAAKGTQPVKIAVMMFGMTVLASYAAAALRAVEGAEASGANRGLIMLASWAGVALLCADGVHSRARFETLMRRLTIAAAVLAWVGMLQFFTGIDIAAAFQLPGLSPNYSFGAVSERSALRRVQGTAGHPIEFAVVLALVLPIAIHYAMIAPPGWKWRPRLYAGSIAAALPMAISRSGVVGLVVGILTLSATWTWAQRRRFFALATVFFVALRLVVPGLLGTIKSLFMNLSSDPSVTGRTEDYVVAEQFFKESPAFGRGMFTFLPEKYTTFDNQYLVTLVELGAVGLTALLLMLLVGVFTARGARRRSNDDESRHLAQALAASLLASIVTAATFDQLSFSIASGLTFLLLGCAGAWWRLARDQAGPAAIEAMPAIATDPMRTYLGGEAEARHVRVQAR